VVEEDQLKAITRPKTATAFGAMNAPAGFHTPRSGGFSNLPFEGSRDWCGHDRGYGQTSPLNISDVWQTIETDRNGADAKKYPRTSMIFRCRCRKPITSIDVAILMTIELNGWQGGPPMIKSGAGPRSESAEA
jgi:hypothetical protein